jgi:predicted transcriptional regulator
MKDVITQQIDENDIKRASLISEVGNLSILEGKIIVALIEKKTLDTPGLVTLCDSMQPQISVATQSLIEKGYIVIEKAKANTDTVQHGRAKNIYALKVSVKEFVATLEKECKARFIKMETDIKRLKELS